MQNIKLVFFLLVFLQITSALAQANLVSATPKEGSVVRELPNEVQLVMSEAIDLRVSRFRVYGLQTKPNADPREVAQGFFAGEVILPITDFVKADTDLNPKGVNSNVAIGLRENLPAGTYVVTWRAYSTDLTVQEGFTFFVYQPHRADGQVIEDHHEIPMEEHEEEMLDEHHEMKPEHEEGHHDMMEPEHHDNEDHGEEDYHKMKPQHEEDHHDMMEHKHHDDEGHKEEDHHDMMEHEHHDDEGHDSREEDHSHDHDESGAYNHMEIAATGANVFQLGNSVVMLEPLLDVSGLFKLALNTTEPTYIQLSVTSPSGVEKLMTIESNQAVFKLGAFEEGIWEVLATVGEEGEWLETTILAQKQKSDFDSEVVLFLTPTPNLVYGGNTEIFVYGFADGENLHRRFVIERNMQGVTTAIDGISIDLPHNHFMDIYNSEGFTPMTNNTSIDFSLPGLWDIIVTIIGGFSETATFQIEVENQ